MFLAEEVVRKRQVPQLLTLGDLAKDLLCMLATKHVVVELQVLKGLVDFEVIAKSV